MVNYVCRTCLYVCDNEFSFKKIEKVKQVLEVFVPEVKTFVGKYSLICEQCYYFLKNVEKFKMKCIETQKKLYSMNVEAIKNRHDAILRSVINETNGGHCQRPAVSQFNLNAIHSIAPKRSNSEEEQEITKKRCRPKINIPITSTATSESNTLPSTNQNTEESHYFFGESKTAFSEKSAADDLLALFNFEEGIGDLKGFREFAVKSVTPPKEPKEPKKIKTKVSEEKNTQLVMNYEDDEEYMTRKDVVQAGFLSDDESGLSDQEKEAESESEENEIIEIDSSDEDDSDEEKKEKAETKVYDNSIDKKLGKNCDNTAGTSIPMTAVVKKELVEDENPGFFNKQCADGFYKCRLCPKQYKTSKGLYDHTKKNHKNEVKIHHCEYCSFFTLWNSALVRHYNIFHMDIIEKNNPTPAKCYHCSFESRSKDQLSHHILDNHVYDKFFKCSLCRSRFADKLLFAQHVEKEHFTLDSKQNFDSCNICHKLFFSKDKYIEHLKDAHLIADPDQTSSVIKEFCASCNQVFNSKKEFHEHVVQFHPACFVPSV